jgi:hypothetical protein
VSTGEYQLLGDVLLAVVVAFFGLALPGYALVRKWWPESGWNLGGNVGTSVIQPLDLVVAGGYMVVIDDAVETLRFCVCVLVSRAFGLPPFVVISALCWGVALPFVADKRI